MNDLNTLTQQTVESLVNRGAHADAWAFYQNISQPTPQDDRAAGLALWRLGRFEEAKIPLYRAAQRGVVDASVDLIGIFLCLNELQEANQWVETSQKLELTAKAKIRVLLYSSEVSTKSGKNRQAIKTFKSAWMQVNVIENAGTLIAEVSQSLASSLQSAGNDKQALEYLRKALLKTDGFWQIILQITAAQTSIDFGDLEQAQLLLKESFEGSESNLAVKTYFLITNGQFYLAQKAFGEALKNFESSIAIANQIENNDFKISTRLAAASVHVSTANLDEARTVLMPLQNLELAPNQLALKRLRFGVLHLATGDLPCAKTELEAAALTFSTLEHHRELGWSLLRLAQWYLLNGDIKLANQTLERVSDVANGIGGTAFLVPELNLMGAEAVEALSKVASRYAMHALAPVLEPSRNVSIPLDSRPLVRRLRVITLGKPMLLAEDRNVTPRLNKAMELIAYLVMHPQSSLERILDAVFPDSDLKAGANYFHQIRHKLTRDVPELRIVQDKQTKLYALDSGTIPLESDYEDVVKLLNHATHTELHQALEIYRGPFMPHLESEWVEEVRNNVEWLLVRSGLRVVQDLYDRGNFDDCRKLTEKLRKVAPLDVGLNEMLVRATNEIDGLLAARRTLSDVEKYFHTEVGELPEPLENLKRNFKLNLN